MPKARKLEVPVPPDKNPPPQAPPPPKYIPDEQYDLPLNEILILDQKLRRDTNDEKVIELAASILESSLLEPIGFRLTETGEPELLYGGRRLAAHKRLKRATIKGIYKPVSDADVKATALIENLQREQLTLGEEIDAIIDLHERKALSPNQISVRISKSRDWVLRRLAVPQLPDDLRTPLLEGRLPLGTAEELAALENESIRAYATNQAMQSRLSQSQTRDLVQALASVQSQEDAIQAGVDVARTRSESREPTLSCQACGKMRKISDLMVVRICKPECPPDETQTNGHNT